MILKKIEYVKYIDPDTDNKNCNSSQDETQPYVVSKIVKKKDKNKSDESLTLLMKSHINYTSVKVYPLNQ